MNNFIGERLKIVRNSLNMKTQSLFADKLGINQTTLSKYENGTSDIPDDIKVKISNYGINLHWLLTGEGDMFRRQEPEKPIKEEKHPLVSDIEALIKENMKAKVEGIESRLSAIEERLKPAHDTEYPTDTGGNDDYAGETRPEYVKIPFYDNVAAGSPIEQIEDGDMIVDVPRRFIKKKQSDYYAIRVRGNSMIDALITDGALALIHKSDVPEDEKIQLVRIDGRSTLKRMREGEGLTWTLFYEDGSEWTIPLGENDQVQGTFEAVLPPATRPRMRGE